MIDRIWLEHAACLAGADIRSDDLDRLCKELGVEEEVLPFLVISAQGFADWPLARQALRQAARSAAPACPAQAQATAVSARHQRAELRQALQAVLADADVRMCAVPAQPSHDTATPMAAPDAGGLVAGQPSAPNLRHDAARLLARHRAAGGGPAMTPNVFIPVD